MRSWRYFISGIKLIDEFEKGPTINKTVWKPGHWKPIAKRFCDSDILTSTSRISMNGSFLAWQTLCLLCCLLTLFGYLVSVLSRFWHVLRGWSGENTLRAWQASMQVFLWRVVRQVNDATLTRQIDNSHMKLARVCKIFPCELYSFQLWQCLNSIDNFSVSTFQGEFKFHKMKAMQDVHLCMYVCMYVCMYGGFNLKVGWNIICMCVCMYTCVYVCMFHKVTFDWCLSQLVVAVRLWFLLQWSQLQPQLQALIS